MIVSSSSMPTSSWSRMNSSPGPPCGRPAGFQRRLGVLGTERDRALQHRRAVALVGLDRRRDLAGRRRRRLDLLALDDHRAEVAADAAPLPPGVAPQLDGERVELAEVGGSLDRRAEQAERRRRLTVVDALAALVRLLLEHLGRPAPRSGQRDLGVEGGHRADPDAATAPAIAASGNSPRAATLSRAASHCGRAAALGSADGEEGGPRAEVAHGHRAGVDEAGWRPERHGQRGVQHGRDDERDACRGGEARSSRRRRRPAQHEAAERRQAGDEEDDPRHCLPAVEVERLVMADRRHQRRSSEAEHGDAQAALAGPALAPCGPAEERRRGDVAATDQPGQRRRVDRPREVVPVEPGATSMATPTMPAATATPASNQRVTASARAGAIARVATRATVITPPGTVRDGPRPSPRPAAAPCSSARPRRARASLRPAVHAGLADAEPLGGQGLGEPVATAAQRRLEQRALQRVALGVRAHRSAAAPAGSGAARRRRRRGGPRRRRSRRGTPAGRSRRSSRRSSQTAVGSHAARRPTSSWASARRPAPAKAIDRVEVVERVPRRQRRTSPPTPRRAVRSGHRCRRPRGAAATAGRWRRASRSAPRASRRGGPRRRRWRGARSGRPASSS